MQISVKDTALPRATIPAGPVPTWEQRGALARLASSMLAKLFFEPKVEVINDGPRDVVDIWVTADVLEVISELGVEGEGSIAWSHGMASPHRSAVGADSTASASGEAPPARRSTPSRPAPVF